jgi:hypothetical protein
MTTVRTILEVTTPQNTDIERFVDRLAALHGFDAVILGEQGGLDIITVASMLKQRCDMDIFLKLTCRDRNRIAVHSQLMTAASLSLHNIIILDGVYPTHTSFSAAKPVYELDALNLLRMLTNAVPAFGDEPACRLVDEAWTVGVQVGGSTDCDMARARKFWALGADLFFTSSLETIRALKEFIDTPIFLCVAEEAAHDISEKRREADSAGAHGLNVIAATLAGVINGSTAREKR